MAKQSQQTVAAEPAAELASSVSVPPAPPSLDPSHASVLQRAAEIVAQHDFRAQWEKERAELLAQIRKGNQQITQEKADAMFPKREGAKRFSVILVDGNKHPHVDVWAVTESEAKALYNVACGIRSVDKQELYTVSIKDEVQ